MNSSVISIMCYQCGCEIPHCDTTTYPYVDLDESNNQIFFCCDKCHCMYYV